MRCTIHVDMFRSMVLRPGPQCFLAVGQIVEGLVLPKPDFCCDHDIGRVGVRLEASISGPVVSMSKLQGVLLLGVLGVGVKTAERRGAGDQDGCSSSA